MEAEPSPVSRKGLTRNTRRIVTPDGIELVVEVADNGARAVAFMLDFVFWIGGTLALFLLLLVLFLGGLAGLTLLSVVVFLAFLIRLSYFLHFELAWQGRTPGKRICGLRVIDRGGGRLTPGAIVARNLTREVEIFLPLGLVMTLPSQSGFALWQGWALLLWVGVLALMPLFNRDHARGGDLMAGTMVIALPKVALLAELAEATKGFHFTTSQLSLYGTLELQVLEDLLRRPASTEADQALAEVCRKICRKIGWSDPVPSSESRSFLRAFYTAERDTLETAKIMGRERPDKHAVVSKAGRIN